jgi:hypothetical protein
MVVRDLRHRATSQREKSEAPIDLGGKNTFFAESEISATTILLDPTDGQRPQLAERLSGDVRGVVGFNSHWATLTSALALLHAAAECGMPCRRRYGTNTSDVPSR